MNCKTILSALLLSVSVCVFADDPRKLSGTVIGTEECIDYDQNGIMTTTVNTAANLFDNDLDSYFATFQTSGGWAGLDLGKKCIITAVEYCPRAGFGDSLLLGVFEGANNPDFGDAIPLYIITSRPDDNMMTYKSVDCSRGFRYVRYIGPVDVNCNIAELMFYGEAGDGDDSKMPEITNLPTVSIHTTNAKDIVSKEQYIKGIVSVISAEGTKIYTDSVDIRGRGNASWTFEKKPYRMRLYNNASLLELPANERNWTLINNYGDKTLMRNLLAFDLSERFEMVYTPAGVPVNMFLNGEYKGCYHLCDHIQARPKRIEVEELEKKDIRLPELSGGYLIEIDAYAEFENSWFTSAKNNTPVTIKYPGDDDIVSAQYNYIKEHFNKLEEAVFSDDFTDPDEGYRKYLDVESFIKHFLIGEIAGNTDTYWSVYMYKKRDDDRFYTGPIWDFDLAYENDRRTYPINDVADWVYYRGGSVDGMKSFINMLFGDLFFYDEVKRIYASYRESGAITEAALLKVVDDYASVLDQSQRLNFMRWKIMDSLVHLNPIVYDSYYKEVENVKSYIAGRIKLIDSLLSYTDTPNEPVVESDVKIWSVNGGINVDGLSDKNIIYVYNMIGKCLFFGDRQTLLGKKFSKGAYFVKIIEGSGMVKSSKIAVL